MNPAQLLRAAQVYERMAAAARKRGLILELGITTELPDGVTGAGHVASLELSGMFPKSDTADTSALGERTWYVDVVAPTGVQAMADAVLAAHAQLETATGLHRVFADWRAEVLAS